MVICAWCIAWLRLFKVLVVKMKNTVYVILASWNTVLYRVEAWSDNYYLIKTYYDNYYQSHPLAIMVEYNVPKKMSTITLANMLGVDYGVDCLEDFAISKLKISTSMDNKLSVIYKSMYDDSFNTSSKDIDLCLYDDIVGVISGVFLSLIPLTKYLCSEHDLMDFLFNVCYYTLKSPSIVNLDMVYVWRFLLTVIPNKSIWFNMIFTHHRDVIPLFSTFIHNDKL